MIKKSYKNFIILFILFFSFTLTSCNGLLEKSNTNIIPPNTTKPGGSETTAKYDDSKSMAVVVKAVEKSVEKNKKLSLKLSATLDNAVVSYPFRNIKVINPLEFYATNANNKPDKPDKLNDLCGEGDYRIVIAKIQVEFIGIDSVGIISYNWHEEDVIIIYGSSGKTHCLTNGVSYKWKDSTLESAEYDFSNHKKLVGNEIVKDGDSQQSYLVNISFLEKTALFNSDSSFTVLPNSVKEFKTEDVYSIHDLI